MPDARIARVHDRLFVGLSCREHRHTDEVRALGITHWIDHRRSRCDEALLGQLASLTYVWNPTRDDGEDKPLAWYVLTVGAAVEALQDREAGVLLSCARGQHRGPSMVYAVLRAHYGMSPNAARSTLESAWPLGDPRYSADIERQLPAIRRRVSRSEAIASPRPAPRGRDGGRR